MDVNRMAKTKDLLKARADFLTPMTSLVFTKLRQAFTQAPILCYFDPEYQIWIKIDKLGYVIC